MPARIAALPKSKGGLPVPYVASWEGEEEMMIRADPLLFGQRAVFPKHGSKVGKTRPVFGIMEPSRQRECLMLFRCQVCHAKLAPIEDLVYPESEPLWLIDMLHEPDTMKGHNLALEPWVCDECLVYALQVCPGMVKGIAPVVELEVIVDRRLLLRNVLAVWSANAIGTMIEPHGNIEGQPRCIGYAKIEPLRFTRMSAATFLHYGPATVRDLLGPAPVAS